MWNCNMHTELLASSLQTTTQQTKLGMVRVTLVVFDLTLNHWHELWKQEKCSSLAPSRGIFIRLHELGRVSNQPDWCQFSPQKSLEIFDKNSADKLWSEMDKELKVSPLMAIRVK